MGSPSSTVSRDVAVVVPYRDGSTETTRAKMVDAEGGAKERSLELEPIDPTDTPFFHIDLQSAVEAAESGAPVAK
jgi:sodium-independent sulfate anion transporter 11